MSTKRNGSSSQKSNLWGVNNWGTQKASINSTIWYCEGTSGHFINWYGAISCLLSQSINLLFNLSKIHLFCIPNDWNYKPLQVIKVAQSLTLEGPRNNIILIKKFPCAALTKFISISRNYRNCNDFGMDKILHYPFNRLHVCILYHLLLLQKKKKKCKSPTEKCAFMTIFGISGISS